MSALDEILAMAREADLLVGQQHRYVKELMKFANLVIEAERDKGDLTIAYMAGHAKGVESGRKQAQQVAVPDEKREPLSGYEITKWWASENGLEDYDMCIHGDFEAVIRAVEAFHGIGAKQ